MKNAWLSHDAVHDGCGTQVVWKTIRVEWLLMERTPPACICLCLGEVGYFAHTTLSKVWGYSCIVGMERALHFSSKGLGNSLCGHIKMIGYHWLQYLVLQELL